MKSTTIVIAFLVFFLGCGAKDSQDPAEYSKSLIIPQGAENIRYYKMRGTDQVQFQLKERFPANSIIQYIDTKLKDMGWFHLEYDFLNPDIPTSHIAGWRFYIDRTKSPELEVKAWGSDWRNERGDIVTYSFRYSYPRKGQPNLTQVQATAIYSPSDLVKKIVAETERFRRQQKD